MPGFICPSHGRTFLTTVCEHIGLSIDSKSLPERVYVLVFDAGHLPGDPETTLLFKYFHCPVCVELYNLPAEDSLLPGDEMDSLPDVFVPVCSDCFGAASAQHGMSFTEKIRALYYPKINDLP